MKIINFLSFLLPAVLASGSGKKGGGKKGGGLDCSIVYEASIAPQTVGGVDFEGFSLVDETGAVHSPLYNSLGDALAVNDNIIGELRAFFVRNTITASGIANFEIYNYGQLTTNFGFVLEGGVDELNPPPTVVLGGTGNFLGATGQATSIRKTLPTDDVFVIQYTLCLV